MERLTERRADWLADRRMTNSMGLALEWENCFLAMTVLNQVVRRKYYQGKILLALQVPRSSFPLGSFARSSLAKPQLDPHLKRDWLQSTRVTAQEKQRIHLKALTTSHTLIVQWNHQISKCHQAEPFFFHILLKLGRMSFLFIGGFVVFTFSFHFFFVRNSYRAGDGVWRWQQQS